MKPSKSEILPDDQVAGRAWQRTRHPEISLQVSVGPCKPQFSSVSWGIEAEPRIGIMCM